MSPPHSGTVCRCSTEPIGGSSSQETSLCHRSPFWRVDFASVWTCISSGRPSTHGDAGWTCSAPNRLPNATCCSWSMGWSRKNTTPWASSARRISAYVSSPSGSRRSTPEISAPIAGVSGSTEMRRFMVMSLLAAACRLVPRRAGITSPTPGRANHGPPRTVHPRRRPRSGLTRRAEPLTWRSPRHRYGICHEMHRTYLPRPAMHGCSATAETRQFESRGSSNGCGRGDHIQGRRSSRHDSRQNDPRFLPRSCRG